MSMRNIEPNYFVCTLGEAAQPGIHRPYTDVNQLIEKQAREIPSLPAIGLFEVSTTANKVDIDPHILTFKEVYDGISVTAGLLRKQLDLPFGHSVGLLAASSPEFLFTWLACVRLGLPVLLVAPQLSPSAIAHLCKTCGVSILLTDDKHENLGKRACEQNQPLENHALKYQSLPLPKEHSTFSIIKQQADFDLPEVKLKQDDTAYFHHTSGTSSGLPKPIPQSQHGSVAVLPALEGRYVASFSTTPLYHGAPADIMRSWTSSALIWLFPGKDLPITAINISKCLNVAQKTSKSSNYAPIRYFASVPYILQMMVDDEIATKWLQQMDIVSVGGAALPVETGSRMIEQDINLVSRFGSSEVGFLLSSHRDYTTDDEWQYLRHNSNVSQIDFEERDGGLYELIAKSDWPHLAKHNRDDGSFATSDLFEPHPTIKNAWRYHSRADSQLTLITGEKFDPAPIEDAIAAATALLADVLVFGNGKPYPGALLFRSKDGKDISNTDILSGIESIVEKVNRHSPSHARIPRNMLVLMPYQDQPLEKSSKGTVLRKKADERFESEIEKAYQAVAAGISKDVPDQDVSTIILELVESIMGDRVGPEKIDFDSDLFSHGVDSVACVQIRHGLVQLLPGSSEVLPLTVVEDSRTVSALSALVIKIRHGEDSGERTDQRSQIPALVKQYSQLDLSSATSTTHDTTNVSRRGQTILLTGPTGSLGSHVLSYLLFTPLSEIPHIYLLIRGASPAASRERVLKALRSRQLPIPADFDNRVTILSCKLAAPRLGLSDDDYLKLQREVTTIFHLAWQVNFLLSLGSFTQHLSGLQSLLQLSLSSRRSVSPRLVFCSSVASVSNYTSLGNDQNIPERIVANVLAAGSTGYSQSKLSAELILSRCATIHHSLHDRITILRVGQLSPSTRTGVWNGSEAYPQILASAKFTSGLLPDLGTEEKLTWLPVDIAAAAFVEAGLDESKVFLPTMHVSDKNGKRPQHTVSLEEYTAGTGLQIDTSAIRVVHLINPDMRCTFTDFLTRLQALESHIHGTRTKLNIAPAREWLAKLESLQNANTKAADDAIRSLLRLLPFWQQIYSDRKPIDTSTDKEHAADGKSSNFDVHNSLITMPALTRWLGRNTVEGKKARFDEKEDQDVGKYNQIPEAVGSGLLEEDYVRKVWVWVVENVPGRSQSEN